MLSIALTEYAAEKLGLDKSRSIDRHFWDRAKRDKKRVIPLESFDQTLKILTSLNDSQQEYLLTETLRDIAKTNHMMQDVTTAWLHGDTDKIDKLVFEVVRRNPEVGKILTIDRNKKWMPSIEAQIKRGEKLFIAVGLGHLLGKDSLVDLLSKRGFKVRQL
jgi:uncharacterized protein